MTRPRWRLYREKLLYLRKQKGWTQDAVVEGCEMLSARHYSRLENGKTLQPRRETLEDLCRVFGLDHITELKVPVDMPVGDEYLRVYEEERQDRGAACDSGLLGSRAVKGKKREGLHADVITTVRENLLSYLRERREVAELDMRILGGKNTLQVGDSLRIRVRTRLSGWLTVISVAQDFSMYLVPRYGNAPFMPVTHERAYTLPDEYPATKSWPVQGEGGDHLLIGIVARTQRLIVVPDIPNLRVDIHRGVGVELATLWGVPTTDLSVGLLEFSVHPTQ